MHDRKLVCVVLGDPRCLPSEALCATGWGVHPAFDLASAHELIGSHRCSVGLIMAQKGAKTTWPAIDEFLSAHDSVEWVGAFDPQDLALPACRNLVLDHLFDHHTLPLDHLWLTVILGQALARALLRRVRHDNDQTLEAGRSPIVGSSVAHVNEWLHIRRIAKVDAPVMICGESGSGKELAAQAIHRVSARAGGPFVAVNCGAIQPTLIQSELFGHQKGSFTGAVRDKRGLFEEASGGTVFLDEIGDLPFDQQVNLLRFLQDATISRVGSTKSIHIDARVIAATHCDLEQAIVAGTFREDLFYRLNVLQLRVPPLRECQGDIELLARHFFSEFSKEKSPQLRGFSRHALATMEAHPWRGNVRELINRVRRAMVMAEGRLIMPADLGLEDPPDRAPRSALNDRCVRAPSTAQSSSAQTLPTGL